MGLDQDFWKGKRVFLTGHTGFKGAWLSLWLKQLGSVVTGYSLEPPTDPSLYKIADVASGLEADHRADILDLDRMQGAMKEARPDIVIHMAAQSLVRLSYDTPVYTYAANVMGTVNVLECARNVDTVRGIVIITTDKCYDNVEWVHPYREPDPMGGHDPYSSSKGCAELATAAYRSSFFNTEDSARVASARAGNVVGGGDWAKDRLVPDCIRAYIKGDPVVLRYPHAVRPWQHVLEPLSGYLMLAQQLCSPTGRENGASGWNFGPNAGGEADVVTVASLTAKAWGDGAEVRVESAGPQLKEAGLLRLDSTKARSGLGWQPVWSIEATLQETVSWYKAWHAGEDMGEVTAAQISRYSGMMA
ncbi:MAG: CDP-glucose 4,6-dehydratase [Alphaproteobacteria bacterium]|nr:CDP-glucose 4,6-dehydratase [Alphaproteobacteria bacterium]